VSVTLGVQYRFYLKPGFLKSSSEKGVDPPFVGNGKKYYLYYGFQAWAGNIKRFPNAIIYFSF